MINESQGYMNRGLQLFVFLCLSFLVTALNAASLTINVVDQSGNPITDPNFGFRWLLERDNTFPVDPANPGTTADELLSLSFHASNHEVGVATDGSGSLSGNVDASTATIGDIIPAGRYYVSVHPYSGYSLSGDSVDLRNVAAGEVTVTVQQHPIPTAQISIYLFEDKHPVNGVPDLPEEQNDGSVDWTQFSLFLEEPGGRYGAAGGQVIQDAFGNYLGTTYDQTCATSNPVGTGGDTPGGMINATCIDADGNPVIDVLGDGTMQPNADGYISVKNLAPGKYGVVIIPPPNQGWQQTSTIEGSKVIDAWVKANEPAVFVEFGIPGPHVFMGFVQPFADLPPAQAGEQVATVSGTVTDMHMSRNPATTFFTGRPFPQCWVAINQVGEGGALGRAVYADACDADSNFSIGLVPPGQYQLAVWDANLDVVFASLLFTVDPTGGSCNGGTVASCSFGDVPVFNWFTRLNTGIFRDDDQDGFWDDGEIGIGPESQETVLRWRDGTIYQAFPTDGDGLAPFDEVFPFFHWLVAEVSFGNKKATGATFVVDAGGEVRADGGWADPTFGELNPQGQCEARGAGHSDIVISATDPRGAIGDCLGSDDSGATWVVENARQIINPNTGNNLSRTETGLVLTQGFQGFLGQTSVMQFGKVDYVIDTPFDFTAFPPRISEYVGENGGISGIVYYATTRAEDEPQFAAAEEWEPGVPRVQLALYADGDVNCPPLNNFPGDPCDIDWNGNNTQDPDDGVIEDINGIPGIQRADVNNHPLAVFPGPEDVDYNGNGVFDMGDALQVTHTDSWDDNLPTGCQGTNNPPGAEVDPAVDDQRCFDGLRNFNQVRDALFDGGYAFEDYDLDHLASIPASAGYNAAAVAAKLTAFYAGLNTGWPELNLPEAWLIPGDYLVESATPAGYKLVREHHKNVDYGDEYIPSLQAFPATCVGEEVMVPEYLAMATKDGSGDAAQLIPGVEAIGAPFAGEMRPLCDLKHVPLSAGQNAAAEFFLMTDVPKAGNISGMILNDLANEFNPNSPQFGEKFAPPHVPVAFYDWNGNEINRVYADKYGRYNLMVASTTTANLPMPSGMSPNMLVSCMNDAGPIPNPDFTGAAGDGVDAGGNPEFIIDPHFDTQYSQFCYTFQYMPGTITYLDTPVEPVAAFAGPDQFPLDCEAPTQTPAISTVLREVVPASGIEGPFVVAGTGENIVINAKGLTPVRNPEWANGDPLAEQNIDRDYGFGTVAGSVLVQDRNGNPVATLGVVSWGDNAITASTGGLAAGEYQLLVEHSNGSVSPSGITLTVGIAEGVGLGNNNSTYNVVNVPSAAYPTIQDAIGSLDNGLGGVNAGDLIIVRPGLYNEMLIMWKPVKLQGFGAEATILNARQTPTEKIIAWRELAAELVGTGTIDQLPGQLVPVPFFGGVQGALGAPIFPTEEGAGIMVAGKWTGPNRFHRNNRNRYARIDGLSIIGASTGGGIVANGYTRFLVISNNRLTTNSGFYGGGIRIGHSTLTHEVQGEDDEFFRRGYNSWLEDQAEDGFMAYDDAFADGMNIHHNEIIKNGGLNGAGGGISIHTGANNYRVRSNWICGNFSKGDGAGIGHLGLSRGGQILDNTIIFNESFSQTPGTKPAGAGIFVGGLAGLRIDEETGLTLSPGSGSVNILGNEIRGNLAGAGDGGGIALLNVNGEDITKDPDVFGRWYRVIVANNMLSNNVAGVAGAISLSDSVRTYIRYNTIANNDSTATGSQAFGITDPNQSIAKPAGVVARYHSATMMSLIDDDVAEQFPGSQFDETDVRNRSEERMTFSDPISLVDNIVYHNRSFYWRNTDDPATVVLENGLVPASCDNTTNTNCDITVVNVEDYTQDLAVLNGHTINPVHPQYGAMELRPLRNLLQTGASAVANNTYIDGYSTANNDPHNTLGPVFVNGRFNEDRNALLFPEFKVLQAAGAFDEGGNFLQVNFGPLTLLDIDGNTATADALIDYHLEAGSPAIDAAAASAGTGIYSTDIDGDARPQGARTDTGADERL
ncbi:MAG: hypothetical protein JAY94_07405 [Candidatus Thiodiazotropha endolucinida]|nr:hypothetical protein [Candidatus Thiodiazotropha taylori]MCW4317327.1 hypothetical protein [Candidatus Thiodiazotropha taylori]